MKAFNKGFLFYFHGMKNTKNGENASEASVIRQELYKLSRGVIPEYLRRGPYAVVVRNYSFFKSSATFPSFFGPYYVNLLQNHFSLVFLDLSM